MLHIIKGRQSKWQTNKKYACLNWKGCTTAYFIHGDDFENSTDDMNNAVGNGNISSNYLWIVGGINEHTSWKCRLF